MIEVKNFTKKYGTHIAVNNISFNIDEGEIVGFLGPNGAGKTTTMSMMTGYISSTEGSVKINGFDILDESEKAKAQIGYLPDVPPLYGDMTVMEYLKFVCDIKKVKKMARDIQIDTILKTVKLTEVKDRIIKNLSKGYRQRVGLAQALVGFPKVLILDEPTVGLDPKQIIEMRDVIKELGKKHTILLSSHILSEVSAVCDRILIINKGEILADGKPEELSDKLNSEHKAIARIKGDKEEILNVLSKGEFKNVTVLASKEEGSYDVEIEDEENSDVREKVFKVIKNSDLILLMLKSTNLSLEEIFLQVTNNNVTLTDEKEITEGGENSVSNL